MSMGDEDRGRVAAEGGGSADMLVRVTVTMTRGQHRALKRAARDEGVSASGLVKAWLRKEGR